MGNSLISHGGNPPEGYDVATTGTRVATRQVLRKYWAAVNTSDTAIYLALYQVGTGDTNTAVVGSGIYLAPNGGSFELNNVNMYYDEIWAIHDGTGTKRLSVQQGR